MGMSDLSIRYDNVCLNKYEIWDFQLIGNTPQLWAAGMAVEDLIATTDSGVEKTPETLGVTRRTHADSLENNILEDSRAQPTLEAYMS